MGQPGDAPPPFPVPMEHILELLQKCIDDGSIEYPTGGLPNPSPDIKAHARYCVFHRRVCHPTAECRTLKWIIANKQREGVIVLRGEGVQDVERHPYPAHERNVRHRVNVIEAEDIEEGKSGEDYSMAAVGAPDHMTDRLMNNCKFKTFFDSMGYTEPARWAATQTLIKVSAEFAEECFVAPTEMYTRPSIAFTEYDKVVQDQHNFALYLEVGINGRTLSKALIDTGASLNVLPRDVFEGLGIPQDRVQPTKVKIGGVSGSFDPAIGQVMLEIVVGPMKQLVQFFIIDTHGDWEMILGRPWIHGSKAVPSSYHQCVKLWHGGKEVTIKASQGGIRHEINLQEEQDQQVKAERSYNKGKRRMEYPRMGSVSLPDEDGVLTKQKERNKVRRQTKGRPLEKCERITLPDGRQAYRL